MRSSSLTPSSNSWFPTPWTSVPQRFIASMVGSSWKSADTSGLAPIASPAATTSVFVFAIRSCLMCVAKYSAPPASTVWPGPTLTRALDPVGGSRLPCRSLNASSWTYVSLSLFFGPFAANALGATMSAAARTASNTFNLVIFPPDSISYLPAARPSSGDCRTYTESADPVNPGRPPLRVVLLEHEFGGLRRAVRERENQRPARALPAPGRLPRVDVDVLLAVVAQAAPAGARRLVGVRRAVRAT